MFFCNACSFRTISLLWGHCHQVYRSSVFSTIKCNNQLYATKTSLSNRAVCSCITSCNVLSIVDIELYIMEWDTMSPWKCNANWTFGNNFKWIWIKTWIKTAAECHPVCLRLSVLTHQGWETHICISKWAIIDSNNDLSPVPWQTFIWTNGMWMVAYC